MKRFNLPARLYLTIDILIVKREKLLFFGGFLFIQCTAICYFLPLLLLSREMKQNGTIQRKPASDQSGQPVNWEEVRKKFSVNKELIWLNNAGVTPPPTDSVEAMQHFIDEFARKGTLSDEFPLAKIKRSIQEIIARLLNCAPEDVAVIHNTAEGMNFISHGLDLREGEEVFLLENEYPSNYYPWEHWGEKGIELTTVPVTNSPERFLEEVKKRISSRTRVVAVSAVHWCTGMPLPLQQLGGLCRENGSMLVVDGAQGAGHVELDMSWGISFMAFSAWKWLIGPAGLGVLVVPKRSLGQVKPVFKGTNSVVDDSRELPYTKDLKPNAERYMYSTGSFVDWVYFNASLQFLDSIGFAAARDRVFELSGYLAERLKNAGLTVLNETYGRHRSAIVVAEKEGVQSATVVAKLLEKGIVTRERLGRIRFSPHILNSREQIDTVITTVSAV